MNESIRSESVLAGNEYRLVDGYHTGSHTIRYSVLSARESQWNPCTGQYDTFYTMPAGQRAEMEAALDKWEAAANIRFVEVPFHSSLAFGRGGGVDIAMGIQHMDGYGRVLGATFVGSGLRDFAQEFSRICGVSLPVDGNDAIMSIDRADVGGGWTEAQRILFHNTILHEFGHAIGIDHSNHSYQVMSGNDGGHGTGYILTDDYRLELRSDDIAAVQRLYGAPPEPTPAPTPPAPAPAPSPPREPSWVEHSEVPGVRAGVGPQIDRPEPTGQGVREDGTNGQDTLQGGGTRDEIYGGGRRRCAAGRRRRRLDRRVLRERPDMGPRRRGRHRRRDRERPRVRAGGQ